MIYEHIVSIAFRLFNFGILVYAIHYVYTNYIAGSVEHEIEDAEKKVAILAQQKDASHRYEESLSEEIRLQQKTIEHLSLKLTEWQKAREEEERKTLESHKIREQVLQKKAEKQSEYLAHYMLERRAMPLAIDELKVSLHEYFNRKNKGSSYIASVVEYMDKDR